MSLFSLEWFKSEREKELEQLKIEEQRLKNQLLQKMIDSPDLFKNYKHDESQNIKTISTSDNISIIMPDKKKHNVEIKQESKEVEVQELPTAIHEDWKERYIGGIEPYEEETIKVTPPATIYKTAKLINNVINVVLRDGTILTKVGMDREFFERVKAAQTEEEICNLFISEENRIQKQTIEKEIEEVRVILKGVDLLRSLSDFVVEDNFVCLKETKRTMPSLLVKEFCKVVSKYPTLTQEELHDNDEYMALKNFFLWCCLNPRPEVANQLYGFLMKNSFRITKQGFFVALRNVVTLNNYSMGRDLLDFVTNSYNKVKAVWKKKPSSFEVFEDNGYVLVDSLKQNHGYNKHVGNLQDLYKNDLVKMPDNRFTDDHTRTFDIRIGQVVNMPPEKCSWSTQDCMEAGLHFTADHIHYVGCGDTSILILINPMKVVGIGEHKGRCYEYLPIMTVPCNEATTLLHDIAFDTLELDEDYAIRELETLTTKSKEGFVSESTQYKFSIPSVPVNEINNIFTSLKQMETTLSKRISLIK